MLLLLLLLLVQHVHRQPLAGGTPRASAPHHHLGAHFFSSVFVSICMNSSTTISTRGVLRDLWQTPLPMHKCCCQVGT